MDFNAAKEARQASRNALKEIRREAIDVRNRLASIARDATFVESVADRYPELPLIPNLRCGAWYTPPSRCRSTCYFKSTDGHNGQWNFSLKRVNLHVVRMIKQAGGCIIVDSTRRGKSIPDAQSKTIPIWCAVLNEASNRRYGTPTLQQMYDATARDVSSSKQQSGWLRCPEQVISDSERSQIADHIAKWAGQLLQSDIPIVQLDRPLVPLFVTPLSTLPVASSTALKEAYPIILLSASVAVPSGLCSADALFAGQMQSSLHARSFTYVQGAGDDHELWAEGLTPAMFWDTDYRQLLLEAGRSDLPSVIEKVIESATKKWDAGVPWFSANAHRDPDVADVSRTELAPPVCAESSKAPFTSGLRIGKRSSSHVFGDDERKRYALVVHCDALAPVADADDTEAKDTGLLCLGLPQGKRGVHAFQHSLPTTISLIGEALRSDPLNRPVLLCCSSAKDLSGALAVAVLAALYSPGQKLLSSSAEVDEQRRVLTKGDIQRRTQWLVCELPDSSPSRAHLNRVNEALLSSGR